MDAYQAAEGLDRVKDGRRLAWEASRWSAPWFVVSSGLLIAWGVVQDLAPRWGGLAFFGFAGVALSLSVLPVTRRVLFRTGLPYPALLETDSAGTRTSRVVLLTGCVVAAVAVTIAFAVLARPSGAGAGQPAVPFTVLALGVVAALGALDAVTWLRTGRGPQRP